MKKLILLVLCSVMALSAAEALVITKPSAAQLSKAEDLKNEICPITKEKIGSMGDGVKILYKGKVIHLCCMGCTGEFSKDPEKYLKTLLPVKQPAKKE